MPAANRHDERYVQVQDAITDAYLQLLSSKSPEEVTVADVVARAGIVRSTFYNHYVDLPSLQADIEDRTIQHIFSMMEDFRPKGNEGLTRSFFLSLCLYARENAYLSSVLRSPSAPDFITKILKMFHRYVRGVVKDETDEKKSERRSYGIAFAIGGAIGFLHKWSSDGFSLDAERAAGILTDLFEDGALAYL
ncbi:MAG: TetR/AcrR family transcriptional regulator [Eubacteriales bacterium]|jgi:AcrR family transcriptional regulator